MGRSFCSADRFFRDFCAVSRSSSRLVAVVGAARSTARLVHARLAPR
jgi:hypothetical protein